MRQMQPRQRNYLVCLLLKHGSHVTNPQIPSEIIDCNDTSQWNII
jgi:hypothetical protein